MKPASNLDQRNQLWMHQSTGTNQPSLQTLLVALFNISFLLSIILQNATNFPDPQNHQPKPPHKHDLKKTIGRRGKLQDGTNKIANEHELHISTMNQTC